MTALVRGLALGVSPDEPETERYQPGQQVVYSSRAGDIDVVVVEHGDDGWVEITDPGSGVGWTVHERAISSR